MLLQRCECKSQKTGMLLPTKPWPNRGEIQMSTYQFKSLTQKQKSKDDTDSKTMLTIQSSLTNDLIALYPELLGFEMSIYESAKVTSTRSVMLHADGEMIICGDLTSVTAKKTEYGSSYSIVIESASKKEHGTLFAYLGDEVSCDLVSFQTEIFDKEEE